MRNIILIFCLLSSSISYCQKRDSLSIKISKTGSANDRFSIFDLSITNYSDSITCILHSPAVFLGAGSGSQELAVTENSESRQVYNLKLAAGDTIYINEVLLYRASIILPYQTLHFKIRIPSSKKKQLLSIDYFHLFDISYQEFEKEMRIGRWYEKYHQSNKVILLPLSEKE